MAHHLEKVEKAPNKYVVKAEMVLWLQIRRVTRYSTLIKYRMYR